MKTQTRTTPATIVCDPARLPTPLAPMIAGARARGVADALEWLGFAAILLDDRGEALHVNAGARALLGRSLYLEGDRLRCPDAETDAGLEEAIQTALAGDLEATIAIPGEAGAGAIRIRIAVFESNENSPFQLLRAVAILESDPRNLGGEAGLRH